MKKWETANKFRIKNLELGIKDIAKILLENRGIKTKKEVGEFLNPKLDHVTIGRVGIDNKQLKKAVDRINEAIKNNETIVVFGDYDVDGICGTAILWETLYRLGAEAMPYIPHRIEEGYGLSIKGIQNVILNLFQNPVKNDREMLKQVQHDKKGLIITVDNGIVANEAVEYANKQGIDVVITDHHVPSKKLPNALAIVHTVNLCGAGVAYLLAQEIRNSKFEIRDKSQIQNLKSQEDNHLELVALATIADLVPLIGSNRTLVQYGLEKLKNTQRIGLKALFLEARIDGGNIGVYEVGHIIAPRLNASGRLEYAMDSLRLLCTRDKNRAAALAQELGRINQERQQLTEEAALHAKDKVKSQTLRLRSGQELKVKSLLFVAHETYQQGVIGLVAGKLVEEFYKPSIVVSIGEKYSKASARSVVGFNIIEFIRSVSHLLVDAGGHPMAAGFTVETTKLEILQKTLEDRAQEMLDQNLLTRTLRIDCELPLELVDFELYHEIQKLAPFGMGNPEPTFMSRNVVIEDMRVVGNGGRHLKLRLAQKLNPSTSLRARTRNSELETFDAIAFGMGEKKAEFHIGDSVDIAYVIDQNSWNGNKKLQLKIKDFRRSKEKIEGV